MNFRKGGNHTDIGCAIQNIDEYYNYMHEVYGCPEEKCGRDHNGMYVAFSQILDCIGHVINVDLNYCYNKLHISIGKCKYWYGFPSNNIYFKEKYFKWVENLHYEALQHPEYACLFEQHPIMSKREEQPKSYGGRDVDRKKFAQFASDYLKEYILSGYIDISGAKLDNLKKNGTFTNCKCQKHLSIISSSRRIDKILEDIEDYLKHEKEAREKLNQVVESFKILDKIYY